VIPAAELLRPGTAVLAWTSLGLVLRGEVTAAERAKDGDHYVIRFPDNRWGQFPGHCVFEATALGAVPACRLAPGGEA